MHVFTLLINILHFESYIYRKNFQNILFFRKQIQTVNNKSHRFYKHTNKMYSVFLKMEVPVYQKVKQFSLIRLTSIIRKSPKTFSKNILRQVLLSVCFTRMIEDVCKLHRCTFTAPYHANYSAREICRQQTNYPFNHRYSVPHRRSVCI